MNYLVRIGTQTIGPMRREDVLRHAANWQNGSLVVSVAPASTQNFVPLAQFVAGAPAVSSSPTSSANFPPPPPAFGQLPYQPQPAQPWPPHPQPGYTPTTQRVPPQAQLPWQQSPPISTSPSRFPLVALIIGGAAVVMVALLIVGGLLYQRKQADLAQQTLIRQQQQEEKRREWADEQQRKEEEARQAELQRQAEERQRQAEAARQAELQQQEEERQQLAAAIRAAREQQARERLAQVYAEKIGQWIISREYNDGINKSVALSDSDYDESSQSFRLVVTLRWDGALNTSNEYAAEGIITVHSNGSYDWNPTWVNDKIKSWQQLGRPRFFQ